MQISVVLFNCMCLKEKSISVLKMALNSSCEVKKVYFICGLVTHQYISFTLFDEINVIFIPKN